MDPSSFLLTVLYLFPLCLASPAEIGRTVPGIGSGFFSMNNATNNSTSGVSGSLSGAILASTGASLPAGSGIANTISRSTTASFGSILSSSSSTAGPSTLVSGEATISRTRSAIGTGVSLPGNGTGIVGSGTGQLVPTISPSASIVSVSGASMSITDASEVFTTSSTGDTIGGSSVATDFSLSKASSTGQSLTSTGASTLADTRPTLSPASATAFGTETGVSTTGASNTGTITGSTSIPRTSYFASNVPTGIPWGVILTTVSDKSYTLTWTGSQIKTAAIITEAGSLTTQIISQTVGGFIWTLPSLPPGFPGPNPPGPPPGFPKPEIGGGIDLNVPGCIFGCGPPGGGGGGADGGGLPCLIDCGGGGNEPTPTNPEPTNSQGTGDPSTTADPTDSQTTEGASTTSDLCTASSAFPSCTQVISVSSFVSGGTASVETATSTSCTTITACSGVATTEASTTTAASTACGVYCDALSGDCAAATNTVDKRDVPSILGRLATPSDYSRHDHTKNGLVSRPYGSLHDDLKERGLIETPQDLDYNGNIDLFITGEISKDKIRQLALRQSGRFSSAIAVAFDSPPNGGEYYPSVSRLEGCVSVVIVGEKGCWISHFWQGQSLKEDVSDARFQDTVIHSIEQGDLVKDKQSPEGRLAANMRSPFVQGDTTKRIPELADGEGEIPFKPQIYVSIPLNEDGSGEVLYDARVTQIEQTLVGPGRAFEGLSVKRRPYTIRRPPDSRRAYGKVLIQYTNDMRNDMDDRIGCEQTAIYRLWFEDEKMADHEWPAAGNQVVLEDNGSNNKKRQNGACTRSVSSSASTGITTETTNGSTVTTQSTLSTFLTLTSRSSQPTSTWTSGMIVPHTLGLDPSATATPVLITPLTSKLATAVTTITPTVPGSSTTLSMTVIESATSLIAPTNSCNVPFGCTNALAPDGCAILCA